MFHPVGGGSPTPGLNTSKIMSLSKKFDSLTAFSSWLDNNPVNGLFAEHQKESSKDGDKKFTLTESWDDAQNLLQYGWHEGAKRVNAVMASGKGKNIMAAKLYNSVAGFAPNVPAYLCGAPAAMINRKQIKTRSRVVTIVYNQCLSGSIDAKEMEDAAATLFNIVVGLEASGVRVELWTACIDEVGNERANCAVRIKSASQPFNLIKMVYPCVHPSFFRRHVFAFIERAGVKSKNWWGYGRVITDKERIKNSVAKMGLPTENIFSYYTLKGKTEEEILKAIK